jgi:hypothetical protein
MQSNTMSHVKVAASLLLTLSLAGCASMGAGGGKAETRCPPACGLDISLSSRNSTPPEVPAAQETIRVKQGAHFAVTLSGGRSENAATRLEFKGETPFVDDSNRPIQAIALVSPGVTYLQVRSDVLKDGTLPCGTAPGCKYDIVNYGNSRRPPRDPWIIIDQ